MQTKMIFFNFQGQNPRMFSTEDIEVEVEYRNQGIYVKEQIQAITETLGSYDCRNEGTLS